MNDALSPSASNFVRACSAQDLQLSQTLTTNGNARRERPVSEQVLDCSVDGIFAFDRECRVTLWNPVMERLSRRARTDVVGKHAAGAFPLLRDTGGLELFERALRGEPVVTLTRPFFVPNPEQKCSFESHYAPLRDEAGVISGGMVTVRDVTDRRLAEVERTGLLTRERIVRAEAEAANRAKDEFLAVVSHELRTPLTPILGWTRLMLNRKLGEEQSRRALEIIERNVRVQSQVIEDLLDISRIISGKLRLNTRVMNLQTVVEAAIETVATAAESKGISVERQFDSGLSLVTGDPERLQQVVWNLLSNAIKFTPRHGRIRIGLTQVDAHLEITVSDSGEGISPDYLLSIFNRFSQADSTTSRKHGGLGLGLAIVRHLVELHGGTVWAHSAGKGLGATFCVSLPARSAKTGAHDKMEYRAPKNRNLDAFLTGLRVLAVDDEPDSREFVAAVIQQWGGEVAIASSAPEALAYLEQLKPDVLLSDIGMPEMDGFALIRKIRDGSTAQGRDIPAIALTAFARAEDRMRVYTEGFQMHIPKPVDPAELANAIAHVTGRR